MPWFRNDSRGARAIQLANDSHVLFEPGSSKFVDGARIRRGIPDGLTEIEPPLSEDDVPEAPADLLDANGEPVDPPFDGDEDEDDLPQLDHDGDGEPGGSLPHEPPALSGMDKAQLTAQALLEGIDIAKIPPSGAGGKLLIGDIRSAILKHRSAA